MSSFLLRYSKEHHFLLPLVLLLLLLLPNFSAPFKIITTQRQSSPSRTCAIFVTVRPSYPARRYRVVSLGGAIPATSPRRIFHDPTLSKSAFTTTTTTKATESSTDITSAVNIDDDYTKSNGSCRTANRRRQVQLGSYVLSSSKSQQQAAMETVEPRIKRRLWQRILRAAWWWRNHPSDSNNNSQQQQTNKEITFHFQYNYTTQLVGDGWTNNNINNPINNPKNQTSIITASSGTDAERVTPKAIKPEEEESVTGVLLIHPIGVGIGNWFYDRLLDSLATSSSPSSTTAAFQKQKQKKFVFVCPDLLGSSSACSPKTADNNDAIEKYKNLPMLNVSDWTDQLIDLMDRVAVKENAIQRWCIVTNGGCSTIALKLAQQCVESSRNGSKTNGHNVTNVVLSSVPRLPFFLEPNSDPRTVLKSYRRLCGLVGKLFWWYSTRNEGAFIQTFSEKNLAANATNLGDEWRYNCFRDATRDGGKSRYSTFAFLAGTLQDGCKEALEELELNNSNNNSLRIDFIKGKDIRKNQARSWFWQKRKKKKQTENEMEELPPQETIRDYVERKGMGGRELLVGGRIILAHEDASGYAASLMHLLDY